MKTKTPVETISVDRSMMASDYGMYKNTQVFFHRASGIARYETNPLSKKGKISDASVIRAKRAQLSLMAQSQQNEQPA